MALSPIVLANSVATTKDLVLSRNEILCYVSHLKERAGMFWQCLLALLLVCLALAAPAHAASVTNVSIAKENGTTRILIDLDGPFQAPVWFAMAQPDRLVIDLPGSRLTANATVAGAGVIAQARTARFSAATARIVLDLTDPATVAATSSLDPVSGAGRGYQFVMILEKAKRDRFTALVGQGRSKAVPVVAPVPAVGTPRPRPPKPEPAKPEPAKSAPAAAEPVKTAAQATTPPQPAVTIVQPPPAPAASTGTLPVIRGRLPVIVLDAGHGGQDPGAPSVLPGRWEKEATLAIAKAIKTELEATQRYKVVMTRETDIFIPLHERVRIARAAKADLFVSIHADSIANPQVGGATVYTLSEVSSDKEAARLAARENKADIIDGIDLSSESQQITDILIDLAQRETMNYSAEFAAIAVREMSKVTTFRSNQHRFAGFVVLKAPDVPSILLETGYMSNEADSRRLLSIEGQRAIARGLRASVDAYFARRLADRS
jgi:N-acetylmuramoyl-L-alanine amidase